MPAGSCARALEIDHAALPPEVLAKAKVCLIDFLSCALEARELPWSRQAIAVAPELAQGGAPIIGTRKRTTIGDAAFANAVLGHGLVREDMHAGSIAHLGVVVWPTLLAFSARTPRRRRSLSCGRSRGLRGGRPGRPGVDDRGARPAVPPDRPGRPDRRRRRGVPADRPR